MATPTGAARKFLAAGFSNKAAATAWGTAVALGASCGYNCKEVSGFDRSQEILTAKELDTPMPFSGSLDSIKPPEWTTTTDMLYSPGQHGTAIAMFMGTAGTPSASDTSAQTHTFQLANDSFGTFGTFALELPTEIRECASAKPIEWTLKSSGGGFVESSIKFRGNTIINTSAVNGATQMDALTYDDRGSKGRITFKQQCVYMNPQAEASDVIDASHLLNAMGVEVSFKRTGFDGVVPAGADSILEPVEGGYPDIRVKLNFAHFDAANAAYFASAIAETTQKMAIRYTGLVLAGAATVYHSMTLYFPRLRLLVPIADYGEIVKNSIELVAEEADAEPTGMSYHRPYVVLVNTRTTDYLTAHA